jgi:hypothetical protein
MVNAPPLTQMRAQFDSLIDAGWGIPARITRISGTVDAAGEISGGFATLVSGERVWIQAIAGRSTLAVGNLSAETTHLLFQKRSGTPLLPKDRVLPSGATYVFDVINSDIFETHRMAQVKQDLRT